MAKVYDPIMCMMVDEPTKAQDAMPSDLKKAGYEVGTVEKYGSTYYTLVYNGKVISTSPTEANIVEKAKKHYANRHGKAHDVAPATQRYINTIVDESKANAEKFVRQAEQDDDVPENELKYVYKAYNEKFGYKFHDSASALDEAIKTADAKVHDSVDIEHIADYLWTWVSGRDIAHELFDEGLDKYSGPHDPEHKKEAYEFARKYAASELNKVYSKLKSVVEKRLKEGFETNKRLIDSYK